MQAKARMCGYLEPRESKMQVILPARRCQSGIRSTRTGLGHVWRKLEQFQLRLAKSQGVNLRWCRGTEVWKST